MILDKKNPGPRDRDPGERSDGWCDSCKWPMSARTRTAVIEAAVDHVKYAHPGRIPDNARTED